MLGTSNAPAAFAQVRTGVKLCVHCPDWRTHASHATIARPCIRRFSSLLCRHTGGAVLESHCAVYVSCKHLRTGSYKSADGSSDDALIANSVFAEQENSPLAALKSAAVHMSQLTLLWTVRVFLYFRAVDKGRTYVQRDKGVRSARTVPPAGAPVTAAPASQPDDVDNVLGQEQF